MIVNKYSNGGGGSGERGPQGPQGPAGEAENYFLEPASALPQSITWETFEAGKFTNVRAKIGQDGVYLCHWNNDEIFLGLEIENGEPSSNQGYGFEYDENTGKYVDTNNYGVVSYVSDGYVYFMNIPSPVSTLDAYGLGLGNEGEGTSAEKDESTVAALSGTSGLYQVVDGKWQKISGLQGPQGPAGEGGQGGDSNTLQAVGEFNPNAQFGDVQAKYFTVEKEVVVEGELFNDGIDLTGKQTTYIYVDDANGVEFSHNGGRWSISWENETFNLNLVDGEDSITGVYTIERKGDSESGWDINILDGENVVWNMFIAKVYEIRDDNGFGSDYTVPAGREGTVNYTYMDSHNEIDGLYQYDGENWKRTNSIVHLDSLEDAEGVSGITYECKGRFFKWVEGAGATGKWLGGNVGTSNYNNSAGDDSQSLVYTQLPIGDVLCTFKNITTNVGVLVFDGTDLVVYSDATKVTELYRVTLGSADYDLDFNSRHAYVTWIDGQIIFRLPVYMGIINRRNLIAYASHFLALDIDSCAHPSTVTTSDTDTGVPAWNKEGVIVGKTANYNIGRIWLNAPKYQNVKEYFATNGGFNSQLFIPTQGGTAGQVLVSAGEAEPQWITMIKAVKITSAAYEALETKDPNILYLIVDE